MLMRATACKCVHMRANALSSEGARMSHFQQAQERLETAVRQECVEMALKKP